MVSEDIQFTSKGMTCHGVLCGPAKGRSNGAGIVLAHGLGGTVDSGLMPYAEAFAKAGFNALAFDYRGFGLSAGKKRQYISVPDQIKDWRQAIGFLRSHERVDSERIGLWGISFSGGHVLHLAAQDARLRAIVAQAPAIDPVLSGHVGTYQRGEAATAALFQQIGTYAKKRWFSKQIEMLKLAPDGTPGPAMLGSKEAAVYPKLAGPTWRNELHPDSLLFGKLDDNNAALLTDDLKTPMLIQMAANDKIVSNEAIVNFARRCGPLAKLTTYEADHFTMLRKTKQRKAAIDEAIAHYKTHLFL